jgi:hypothetical protein
MIKNPARIYGSGSIRYVEDESQKTPTLDTAGSGTRKFKVKVFATRPPEPYYVIS